jgi:hypothetical protein
MARVLYLFAAVILLLNSCNSTYRNDPKRSSEIDLVIELPSNQFDFKDENNTLQILIPEKNLLLIYGIDFSGFRLVDSIKLKCQFHEYLDWIYSKDTFFLLTPEKLFTESNGNSVSIDLYFDSISSNLFLYNGHVYDRMVKHGELLFHQLYDPNCWHLDTPSCQEYTLGASINIRNGKLTPLPNNKFPIHLENSVFPFTAGISKFKFGNSLIYNFVQEPDIYVYNLKLKTFNSYKAKSEFQEKEIIRYSEEINSRSGYAQRFLIQSPEYRGVFASSSDEYFFRIFLKGQDLLDNEGELNKSAHRKQVIQIIDSNFEVVKEIDNLLNPKVHIPEIYCVSGEILVRKYAESDSTLYFDRLDFDLLN